MKIPKVAVVNDLSGFGKCSLTTALPILSVMGVQACPLATSVLSNQTGFPSYACADLTPYLNDFLSEWKHRDAAFDGIYTGFLCGHRQAETVTRLIHEFRTRDTLVLVDPVLGDNGRIYPALPKEMRGALKTLVSLADVITPNFTEACLLTDTAAFHPDDLSQAWDMAAALAALGPSTVAITGIRQQGAVCNVLYLSDSGERFCVSNRWIGSHGYSGTGDILASVLCAGLVRKLAAKEALQLAARFLEASIEEASADGTDPNEGVAFEHHLHLLLQPASAYGDCGIP